MALLFAFIGVLAAVCLFLFSIQKFSNQMQRIAGEKFKRFVSMATSTPVRGTIIGALITSLIQSSTATTVMVVGLVNAGILSFYNSLGVIFGANIGTTLTTQLLALNITAIAPLIVVIGFFMFMFNMPGKKWGKPIFYFGLVFFSFTIVGMLIEPLRDNPWVIGLFQKTTNLFFGLLLGALFTTVFQSSTVTTGLAIVLTANGFISFEQSVGIVLGANIGTTSTALIASIIMNTAARRAAVAHVLFNVLGVVIFLPFLSPLIGIVQGFEMSPEQRVAMIHLIFNVLPALVFLIFLKPFSVLVENIVKQESRVTSSVKELL